VHNKHHKITGLGLYHCGLKELPLEIVKLQNLTMLYLLGNQLRDLPPEIGKLQNLTQLALRGNPLRGLPPEMVKRQNLTWSDYGTLGELFGLIVYFIASLK